MSNPSITLDWQPVQECLTAARAVREEFSSSWSASLDELADLRANLEAWQRELSEEHDQIQQERSRQEEIAAARVETERSLEGELEAVRYELDRAKNQLQSADMERIQLHEQIDRGQAELELERQATVELGRELELAKEKAADLDAVRERTEEAEQESADARREVGEQTKLAQELHQQNDALETELELVRTRAATLSLELEQERGNMSQARAGWADEIRQMRRRMAQQVVSKPSESTPAPAITGSTPSEIVVGSVLAQFDKIRQQRANRREKR